MAERTVIEYKPGDLVRWFERYADGFMTKDVGDGVVIRKRDFNVAWSDGPYANYSVYRTKYSDTMVFEEVELEYLSNDTAPIEITIGASTND
tara:strand:+ start:15156 stop:15431 length:276 start_codon:yes stop_codon:yes gene_type:complete